MMSPNVYPPQYPQAYAPQPYAAQPYPAPDMAAPPQWPAAPQQAQAWPQQPVAQQTPPATWGRPAAPAGTQPIFRGQAPDDPPTMPEMQAPAPALPPAPPPAPLSMPSPDQLGIAAAAPAPAPAAKVDWAAARERLGRLHAVSFNVDQPAQGGCRFTCFLATAQAAVTHRVEASAATEGDAVRLALDKAEQWAGGK